MIIWRGWGVLAVLYLIAAVLLATVTGPGDRYPLMFAIWVALAGVATWFTGVRLNRKGPSQQANAYLAQRQVEIQQAVEAGIWAPGGIRPSSLEEARASGQATWEAEKAELERARGGHTLFFVPLQYWGIAMGAFALYTLVTAVF